MHSSYQVNGGQEGCGGGLRWAAKGRPQGRNGKGSLLGAWQPLQGGGAPPSSGETPGQGSHPLLAGKGLCSSPSFRTLLLARKTPFAPGEGPAEEPPGCCHCPPFLPWKSPHGTGRRGGTGPICMLETVASPPASSLPRPCVDFAREQRATDRGPASPPTPDPPRLWGSAGAVNAIHAFPVAQKNTHTPRLCPPPAGRVTFSKLGFPSRYHCWIPADRGWMAPLLGRGPVDWLGGAAAGTGTGARGRRRLLCFSVGRF